MSQIRHAILAYLVLSLAVFLVLRLTVLPTIERWQAERAATQSLLGELDVQAARMNQVQEQNRQISQAISALLQSGQLSFEKNAAEISHDLQESLKSLFEANGILIQQLRPSTETLENGLKKSRLELDLRISSSLIPKLISSLIDSASNLDIELLSMHDSLGSSDGKLDVRLYVAMWFIDDSFEHGGLALNQLNIDPIEQNVGDHRNRPVKKAGQRLQGLFDRQARLRFNYPDSKHYRLAAINISKNTAIAIIADLASGKTRRLKQGEMLDAWQVSEIKSDRVILSLNDQQAVLTLKP